jgi:hypothetical protein
MSSRWILIVHFVAVMVYLSFFQQIQFRALSFFTFDKLYRTAINLCAVVVSFSNGQSGGEKGFRNPIQSGPLSVGIFFATSLHDN